MPKIGKALASLVILVVLVYVSPDLLPLRVWSVVWLMLQAFPLTYLITLLFSAEIPLRRRWGIAYLVLTGIAYLLAGVEGLPPSSLFEAVAWDLLISPYPLLTLLRHSVPRSPHASEWGQIYVLAHAEHPLFSAIAIILSLVAIAAAFAMAKGYRIAYIVWRIMLSVLGFATSAYVVLGFAGWGLKEAVLPVCLMVSYLAAYTMARRGAELR